MPFKIYISSAGSGKTHSLAKEYILLCFKYPTYFRNIIAVTFTNKATEEMKNRIIDYLFSLSNFEKEQDEKITEIITELKSMGLSEYQIKDTAKEIINRILYEYTGFSITTIDSFFSRILRSFSKELMLSGNYEIEMDEEKVLFEMIKLLWKEALNEPTLLAYLNKFLLHKLTEGKSWNLDFPISKIGAEIFRDRYWERKFRNQLITNDNRESINNFIKELEKIRDDFQEFIDTKVAETEEILKKFNLSVEDFSGKSRTSIPARIIKLKDNKNIQALENVINKEALINDDKWYTKNSPKKEVISECLNSGLRDIYQALISYLEKNNKKYISSKIVLDNIYVFGIFSDLIQILKNYENEENVILYSNIARRLRSCVTKDNSSFILEKIGTTYNNFLIDEFQDTSTFQWEIIKSLLIESLSQGNLSLVVGDPKQTIYRWREGNMNLILEDVHNDLSKFKNKIKEIQLNTNYRSLESIVAFNNEFFKDILKETDYTINSQKGKNLYNSSYGNVSQKVKKIGIGKTGYVNIALIEKVSDVYSLNTENNEVENNLSLEDIILERLKSIITEVLNKGYRKSDITILIRKSREGIKIAKSLIDSGWDVISPDSLNILNSSKVSLLYSILKFIVNQKDYLSFAEFINDYLQFIQFNSLTTHTIFTICKDSNSNEKNQGSIENYIPAELKSVDRHYLPSFLYNFNIYELVENLVRIFRLNDKADLYLTKFIDIVKEYCRNNPNDIKSFLNWFESKKDDENSSLFSVSAPENTDAIKISTIHKIKGLQNKIIIIPYANWEIQLKSGRDIIWVSSNEEPFNKFPAYPVLGVNYLTNSFFSEDYYLENDLTLIDNLNLLYVAFTRAEEALFVISHKKIGKTINDIVKSKIQQLNNIPEFFNKTEQETINNYIIKTYSKGVLSETKENIEIKEPKLLPSEITFVSSQWYKNIIIKTSDLENMPWKENYNKIQRGIKIHKVLSQLINLEDIENILENEILRGNIDNQEAEYIKEKIFQFSNREEFKLIFDKNYYVMTEAEIITPENIVIRPDRIMINGNNVKLIEFKIGQESKEHITQINKYENILSEAGYKVIEKYIIYITDDIKTLKL
ncbi:MAG: UvrD-helicase domain-containing protein [Ignavibacteria bacterium]|nr:UvrD-helicase domain-containing protein [Ignavibacteria bacterium]